MDTRDVQRYGTSGVHTVEGNIAGHRAATLTKQRELQQQEFKQKKQEIQNTLQRGTSLSTNFESLHHDDDAEFKRQTVGLVTAAEFRKTREIIENTRKSNFIHTTPTSISKSNDKSLDTNKKEKDKKKKKRNAASLLSFNIDGDEENDLSNSISLTPKRLKKRSIKNPNVETDFLPDKEREKLELDERKRLQKEWEIEQERIRNENVVVTYSYWDGLGHRREITIPKKTTIGKYLEFVKAQLCKEFSELRGISAENLLYVKEDLIIPHHYSFYDLIITKARGKSGPLFHFDVHDDIRLIHDARVEKDESHPGKVVERHWYEKNKHIFPASRWEVYDPNVKRDKYTIHGGEVQGK